MREVLHEDRSSHTAAPHMLMVGEGWEQVAAGVERWLADAVS